MKSCLRRRDWKGRMAPGAENKGIWLIETASWRQSRGPRSFYRAQLGCPLLVGRGVQTSGLIAIDARNPKSTRSLTPTSRSSKIFKELTSPSMGEANKRVFFEEVSNARHPWCRKEHGRGRWLR